MPLINLLSEALSQQQTNMLTSMGFQPTTSEVVDSYEIYLLKMPIGFDTPFEYQLGLQKAGRDFTDYGDQAIKVPFDSLNMKALKQLINIVKSWTKQYGSIGIVSSIDNKTQQFGKIMKRYGNVDIQQGSLFGKPVLIIR